MFRSLSISGSALTAERLRLDLVANNLANINTTSAPGMAVYQRQTALLQPRESAAFRLNAGLPAGVGPRGRAGAWNAVGDGVQVAAIWSDITAPQRRYEPDHPHADADGFVAYPNVDVVAEMVDMLTATRAYEANVTAFNAAKDMALRALDIGR